MNLTNELATCIAKIKSWDVFPDQEASRNEVIATLEKLARGLEVKRWAYPISEFCDHRDCPCGKPMPLTPKGKAIEAVQSILIKCGYDSP